MSWALITHPHHLKLIGTRRALTPMFVDETSLLTAIGQGWIVLAKDSAVVDPAIVPAQSNPKRYADEGGD